MEKVAKKENKNIWIFLGWKCKNENKDSLGSSARVIAGWSWIRPAWKRSLMLPIETDNESSDLIGIWESFWTDAPFISSAYQGFQSQAISWLASCQFQFYSLSTRGSSVCFSRRHQVFRMQTWREHSTFIVDFKGCYGRTQRSEPLMSVLHLSMPWDYVGAVLPQIFQPGRNRGTRPQLVNTVAWTTSSQAMQTIPWYCGSPASL